MKEREVIKNKRKFERFKAALDAEYTKVEGCAVINSLTITKNISSGGLCAALSRIIKIGDDLLIELDPPNNKRLATLVKVVWAKPQGNNNRSICGLKILWVSSQTLLKNCVTYAREIRAAA